MSTYIAQATMNALAAGREVHLVEGEPIELSEDEAKDLIRAGYVSGPVKDEPGVQRAVKPAPEEATGPAQRRTRKAP